MDETMASRLAVDALDMGLRRRLPGAGLVAHSDRGSQSASDHYHRPLGKHGLPRGMRRRADCRDNAPVESSFASLKRELVHDEKYTTRSGRRRAPSSTSKRSTTASVYTSPWDFCPRSSSSGRTTRSALNLSSIFLGEDQPLT